MAMNLKKFQHKVRCDIPGCRELATHTLGDERMPPGMRLNVCSKCMQQIALVLPKEMVLKRADIVELIKNTSLKAEENITEEKVEPENLVQIDFDNMNMAELRIFAKAKGKPIPVGFTKEEAIAMCKNIDRWV
jgi:hypothetical protein